MATACPDLLAAAALRMAALRASLQGSGEAPIRLVETHISWVLLAESVAYKLKKPVQFAFLDFSTLALRRRFCEEELRLNRRLAPSLYLDVVEVCDTEQGPRFGGGGPVLDVAVRMRRFPDGALWSEMLAAGTLGPSHTDALAQRLADFHRDAAVAAPDSAFGTVASHEKVTRGLIEAVDAWQSAARNAPLAASDWDMLRSWLSGQQQTLAPLWLARQLAGRVRECHGDLHLANVLQLGGESTAFDGIEFDDGMRWIDVLYDMSFLAMDLLAHRAPGCSDLAFRFINAYLSASGDYDGLPALRYYMVCRALVRSRVTAIGDGQGLHSASGCSAADYLALAWALSRSADPRLAITHGLPGSGKSFLAQGVIEAAAAIGVRADVERKRLFGLPALASSRDVVPGGIYGAAVTERTYLRLRQIARAALRAGWPVVVDAAFLLWHERTDFAALAASLAAPFSIFDCQAELPLLRQRLARRQAAGADASEADAAVLERLTSVDQPLDAAERAVALTVDGAQPMPPAGLARHWLAAV